ncbi:hypothetical protein [Nannocystis punicea]|uniref:Uncharacterized protein n=1 Tax=Nannocystis punicea TaxID=2995304 RepID=A0ABY7HCJ3_9BACT|nr:hypothetical protein [Nannocystis poenicansa]WAS97013.1 hypothetical protein O0S08_12765 [Nannocystis poenicansa]
MRSIALLVSLSAVTFTFGCKSPESGETMTEVTSDPGSSTATTTLNLTDVLTDPTSTTSSSGSSEPTTTTGGTGTATGTGTDGTATTEGLTCTPIACEGAVLACGDCMDNDGDGLVDLADPECITPCDDREDTFATGLPGDNMDPCNQDCFFDGNSGSGNDKCNWSLKCDPANPGGDICPYDPDFNNCPEMQSEECLSNCQVPNGCDCFGCCTVEVDGMTYDIFLGDPDCALSDIASCQQCTKNDDCDEECHPEECEICFGESEPPPGCDDPTCEGFDSCTVDMMGNSNCAEGYYCTTGCCYPINPG